MVRVVLFKPEIAGNVGNIARTCVATGAELHLIRPLGFRLGEAAVRRAGMDYWPLVKMTLHHSFAAFQQFEPAFRQGRVFSFTTKATRYYTDTRYRAGDVLLFGPESRGLPEEIRRMTAQLRIPMRSEARSLNVSVSVGVAVYECWRQLEFAGH